MLYPKKNLIKPLTSSDWAISQHATVLGPYHLKVNQPVQYQASVFSKLDLKPNTLYTLSCEGITENAQFYVKRMLNGVAAYHILKKGIEVLEFTAVAGATYTIEFHNGTVLGEGYVLNFQLEEGKKTPFAPYELANKPAVVVPKKNMIKPFKDAEWSLLAEPTTKVVSDYKLETSAVTGINAINIPVKALTTYTFSALNPDAGVYFIDSYNAAGASIGRHTQPAGNANNSLTFTTIAGAVYVRVILRNNGSTGKVCVWENLQLEEGSISTPFEPYRGANKPANIYTKNLAPPLSNPNWLVKSGQAKGVIVNDYEYKMNIGVVGVVGYDIPITLKPNTTYTLGATLIGTGARMRLMRASDDTFLVNLNPSSPVQTYTTTALTDYKIRIENNGQAGDYTTKDFFIYEGNVVNPVFEPMKFGNKPLVFYPRKNLIPDFKDSRWFADYTTNGGTMVVDPTDPYKMKFTMTVSAQGRLIWIPVEAGKTYTFSYGKMDGLYRIYKRKVGNHDTPMALVQHSVAGLPNTFTFTADADFQGFVTIRLTQGIAGTFSFEQLKLEEGPDKTPFQLYVNNMKPAVLYPQLNLIKPFSKWDSLAAEMVVTSDYKAKMSPTQAAKYSFVTFNVKPNTTYTVKANHNGRLGIYKGGSTAIRAYGAEQTFTFNSGVYDQLSLYFNNASAGDYYLEDVMLYEGTTDEKFEPIKYGNKK